MPPLKIAVVVSELFMQNAYIAYLDGQAECVVVDPGFETEGLLEHIQEHGMRVAAILNTHGHADHIAGNRVMKQVWPEAPLIIGTGDADKLTDPVKNLSRPYGMDLLSPAADRLVSEGEILHLAGLELEVRECPGHSIGHVVFVWRGQSPWIVFGGDVLFQRGVGRTDFPDGSFTQLANSIRTKLYTLPDDTIILTGHGEPTTIGEEKLENPFVPGVPAGP